MKVVLLLLVLAAGAQAAWTGFRIAQESTMGRRDWDQNILGFVQPVDASKVTVKQYYGYGKASFVGSGAIASATRPTPKGNYVIMFLVWNKYSTSKGLMHYTVFDVLNNKKNGAQPGNLYAHYKAFPAVAGIKSQLNDDPGEFRKEGYPKITKAADHVYIRYHNAWSACCTDGHVWGPLAGVNKVYSWLTRGKWKGKYQSTPSRWQFETWGKGARVPLSLAPPGSSNNRWVRLDNHVCDPKVDCNGRGTCNPTTGKCTCQIGYTSPNCGQCVANWVKVAGQNPILCSKNYCTQPTAPPGITFNKCPSVAQGGVCGFTCPTGQVPTGAAKCWAGKWVMNTVKCHAPAPKSCDTQPKYANPQVGTYDVCTSVPNGGVCRLECANGYTLQPAPSPNGLKCVDGKYDLTNLPKCVGKGCTGVPTGGIPTGASWSCANAGTTPHGGKCTLTCPTGYALKSNAPQATCAKGGWDPQTIPVCHKVCVNPPPNPTPMGTFPATCANTHDQGQCTLTCPPNTKKMGDAKCVNGDWEDDDAECLSDLDCHAAQPDLSNTNGGTGWTCKTTTVASQVVVKNGDTCTLKCPTGFTPSKPAACHNGDFTDARCMKDEPKFPEMLCRCVVSTVDRAGHKLCSLLPAPDCTTFITHEGFHPEEEFGVGKWSYAKPWLTASDSRGGQWKCGPWNGGLGWSVQP